MKSNKSNVEVRALAKHIRMSAHKARRVVNQIRGRSYEQALMILEFMPYRACYPILQLISSASANAWDFKYRVIPSKISFFCFDPKY